MANRINNKYEYRSGLLGSLKVEHTASDVRNEDEYRKKVLNGLGVEYTDDDINQKSLYRAKVVEGLASSGGGGGSSDFSTATMTVNGNFTRSDLFMASMIEKDPNNEDIAYPLLQSGNRTYTVILYKGRSTLMFMGSQSRTITVSGNIETVDTGVYVITGDCTITIS